MVYEKGLHYSSNDTGVNVCHGPLTRCAKLQVAHVPGMPGTFPPPPTSKETASWRSQHASQHVHHARAVMHVGIATRGDGENVPGIPGACATLNFTYLARGPCRATCISHIHHYCWRVHWCFLCICFELLSRSKMIIACECDASFGQSKMWIFCRTCKVHHNKILKINILGKLSWGGMVTNSSS